MYVSAFEFLKNPANFELLKSPGNGIAYISELILFTLLTVEILFEVSRSHRLLRRFHAHDKHGGPLKVLAALVATYFRSATLLKPKTWLPNRLFENVQRRVELSIFHDPHSLEWKNGAARAFRETDPEVEVKTSKDVASAEGRIRSYFEIVNQPVGFWDLVRWILLFAIGGALIYGVVFQFLPADWAKFAALMFIVFLIALVLAALIVLVKTIRRKSAQEEPAIRFFVTQLFVHDAFLAPLHLIAGLLHRVDDEWSDIIKVYNFDVKHGPTSEEGWVSALEALRTIQKFTFDCWLLWGPSIPICHRKCHNNSGNMLSIQLGYGDENSSIEIIGSNQVMLKTIRGLADLRRGGELAVNVTARGWLSHSNLYSGPGGIDVSRSIKKSWEADENGRILFLMEAGGRQGEIVSNPSQSFYYTAYLWVCFVIQHHSSDGWRPIHKLAPEPHKTLSPSEKMRSAAPWLDFVPFFEHGNISDDTTYRFLRHQLAHKALDGLSRLVKDWKAKNPGQHYPLRFSYACAIDDSGCGQNIRFANKDGVSDIRVLLTKIRTKYPELVSVVIIPDSDDNVSSHPACEMPEMIGQFYSHVNDVLEREKV
jgi:hypothetical protein